MPVTTHSVFTDVQQAPPIEVFQMNKAYLDDKDTKKVNLGIGAYRNEQGEPWVLPVVREAEKSLADDLTLNHEYLPILGFEPFSKLATEILLGENHATLKENRAFGVQCLSGTGSLRIGADFLHRILKYNVVYVSTPTWENHHLLFRLVGFEHIKEYRYWNSATRSVDFTGFLADLEAAPAKSVIVLHGCAHNPTGMDLNHEQWIKLCEVIKRKNIFPFFDVAYQGFASGNLDSDAWSVRYFADQGLEMFVAQSFAKNFGLYNERVGNLTVVLNDKNTVGAVKSQLTLLVRGTWSNPPSHGAKIVHKVMSDSRLKNMWFTHIQEMAGRIKLMRQLLREKLESLETPGKWNHITEQIGMFSYTGLNEKQVEILIRKYHIYLLKSGRISMAGLNKGNVDYVANAFHDTVTGANH